MQTIQFNSTRNKLNTLHRVGGINPPKHHTSSVTSTGQKAKWPALTPALLLWPRSKRRREKWWSCQSHCSNVGLVCYSQSFVTFRGMIFAIIYVQIGKEIYWLWQCEKVNLVVILTAKYFTHTHTHAHAVREWALPKWSCTTGPRVREGHHSQSQAVFEVWRVNTKIALFCHLLCLFSQDVI